MRSVGNTPSEGGAHIFLAFFLEGLDEADSHLEACVVLVPYYAHVQMLAPLILRTSLFSRCHHHLHFTDKQNEDQSWGSDLYSKWQ